MKKKVIENNINILILIIIFLIGLSILLLKGNFKNNEPVVKKIISNNEFMLNKIYYFVAKDSEINLNISNPKNIDYKINILDENVVSNNNNKLIALNDGYTDFTININNFNCFNGRIYVVKGIVIPPDKFDKSKKFVSCNQYTAEENIILEKTLEDRTKVVGYKTRASVVAAARFLTLEFANRIAYFYENGRLNNYGEKRKVDGEGRYYHKGLYLSKEKYEDISNKFTGPGSWGCKITQYQDAPQYGFVPRIKYPNGLDCSGFISWVLLNGGFDVKDSGAGDNIYRDDDLYDLGEKQAITNNLLLSKSVKVGDLIAYSGHMAIIAGIDAEGNYYVAESLPQFKGVVLNKYNQNKLKRTFTHIMLMDSVYQNDGNLTNMWY